MNIAIASNDELDAYAHETGAKIQIPALPGDGGHKPEGLACAGAAGGRRRQRLVRHSRLRQVRHRVRISPCTWPGAGSGTGAR